MGHHSSLACLLLFFTSAFRPVSAQDPNPDANLATYDTYVTRPDIWSPKWNITVYDESKIAPGYWFVGPYEELSQVKPGNGWIGPHLYDGKGQLVWSGAAMFDRLHQHDVRISTVDGQEQLTMIDGVHGTANVLNHNYEIIDSFPMGVKDETLDMHDLNFIQNGTRALFFFKQLRDATPEMAEVIGHNESCRAQFDAFAELDVTNNWKPVFNWTSYDHNSLDECTMPKVDYECSDRWDYIHANAVDKCDDGDYLVSARHFDSIFKVSHKDGSILWRLGGVKNDFDMGDLNFSRQHDVRCRSQNDTHIIMTFLDNAKGEDAQKPTSQFSRGLIVSLRTDTHPKQAKILNHYDHPDGPGKWTNRRGNLQILPNDNAFVGWSLHALHSEHTHDGEMIMQARMVPKPLSSYRSYKFPFVGKPLTPPDVHSAAFDTIDKNGNPSALTLVHVSWNGATEVADWNLYKTDEDGDMITALKVATAPREGFETAMMFNGYASNVVVEGLDKDGVSLGKSNIISTLKPTNMSSVAVTKEFVWLQSLSESPIDDFTDDNNKSNSSALWVMFLFGFFSSMIVGGVCVWYGFNWKKLTAWFQKPYIYKPLAGKEQELEESSKSDKRSPRYVDDDAST